MTIQDLAKAFSLQNIQVGSAHFDQKQLDFWQKQAIRKLSSSAFEKLLDSTITREIPEDVHKQFIEVMKQMVTFPREVKYWVDILFSDSLEYSLESKAAMQKVTANFWIELLDILSENSTTNYQSSGLDPLKNYLDNIDKKQRATYWKALRAALTNSFSGPQILSVVQFWGTKRTIQRLKEAACLATTSV